MLCSKYYTLDEMHKHRGNNKIIKTSILPSNTKIVVLYFNTVG
jgi:hypothetical protein